MTLFSLAVAKAYAEQYGKHIYVRIEGHDGIWELYPGGRVIKWPDDKRRREWLTLDSEFVQHKPADVLDVE
jgi:hypothetical protein